MTREETAKVFAIISATFPRDAAFAKADRAMLESWHALLGDLPFEIVQAAIQAQASISPFPPSISEIRKKGVELSRPELNRTADEAWMIAIRAVRVYGCSPYPKLIGGKLESAHDLARKNTPPDVWAVMERFGYRDMCMSENIDVIRGQFCRLWEANAARKSEQAVMPPSVGEMAKRIADKARKELSDGTDNPD